MEVGVVVSAMRFPIYYGFLAIYDAFLGVWVELDLARLVCLLGGILDGG